MHDSSIKCYSRADDRLKLKTQIKFRPNKDRHKTEDTIDVCFIPPKKTAELGSRKCDSAGTSQLLSAAPTFS